MGGGVETRRHCVCTAPVHCASARASPRTRRCCDGNGACVQVWNCARATGVVAESSLARSSRPLWEFCDVTVTPCYTLPQDTPPIAPACSMLYGNVWCVLGVFWR